MEDVNVQRTIFLSIFEPGLSPYDSTPGKNAHIWKIERVQTDAIKVANDANSYFLATFSTPSSSSLLLKLLITEHTKNREFIFYNYLFFFRYLYAAYLKGKRTTDSPTCCACCSWWCCKGGRGWAEVGCMQTDCTASCLQTCASCCPTRIPDITNFGVSQFSHKHPYVQKWYNVLQFTKGNMQWVFYLLSIWRKQLTENKRNRW